MKMKAEVAQETEKKARERDVDAVERKAKVPSDGLLLDCSTGERKHQLVKQAWRSTDNAVVQQQQQQQQQPMSPPNWSEDVAFRAQQNNLFQDGLSCGNRHSRELSCMNWGEYVAHRRNEQ